MSQSLLLFRAFQQDRMGGKGEHRCGGVSQSLLLFRAFQPDGTRQEFSLALLPSQSLLLFRAFQHRSWQTVWRGRVAIPSFIQGISTLQDHRSVRRLRLGRNPFFYSGHFNRRKIVWQDRGNTVGRNPFFYSGHFNPTTRNP